MTEDGLPNKWSYARGNADGTVTVHGAALVGTWWRPCDRLYAGDGRMLASGFNGGRLMTSPNRNDVPGGPWLWR